MQGAFWRQIYLSSDLYVFSVQETDADNTKGAQTPTTPKISSYVLHRINPKIAVGNRIIDENWKHTIRVSVTSRLDWVWPVSNRTFTKILRYDQNLYFLYLCKDRCLLSLHGDRDDRILKMTMRSLYIAPNIKKPINTSVSIRTYREYRKIKILTEIGRGFSRRVGKIKRTVEKFYRAILWEWKSRWRLTECSITTKTRTVLGPRKQLFHLRIFWCLDPISTSSEQHLETQFESPCQMGVVNVVNGQPFFKQSEVSGDQTCSTRWSSLEKPCWANIDLPSALVFKNSDGPNRSFSKCTTLW